MPVHPHVSSFGFQLVEGKLVFHLGHSRCVRGARWQFRFRLFGFSTTSNIPFHRPRVEINRAASVQGVCNFVASETPILTDGVQVTVAKC
jgi:hypothetical protein